MVKNSQSKERDEKMKKILTKIFMVIMFVGLMYINTMNVSAAEETASGTCGENLTWVAYSDGSLIISGEGRWTMPPAHWHRWRHSLW